MNHGHIVPDVRYTVIFWLETIIKPVVNRGICASGRAALSATAEANRVWYTPLDQEVVTIWAPYIYPFALMHGVENRSTPCILLLFWTYCNSQFGQMQNFDFSILLMYGG